MTRPERFYKLVELRKGQEPLPKKSLDLKRTKKVSDVEQEEFVKMLKWSEYFVVEQLEKVWKSILSFLFLLFKLHINPNTKSLD